MRLNDFEIEKIKEVYQNIFGGGALYLFGSRLDDTQKGGDIDLYIVPPRNIPNLTERKIDFLVALKSTIGEQKIDVVIDRGEDRPIDRVAKSEGILLWKG